MARDGRVPSCGKGARTFVGGGARSVHRPCSNNVGGNKEFDLVHSSGVPSFTTIYHIAVAMRQKVVLSSCFEPVVE